MLNKARQNGKRRSSLFKSAPANRPTKTSLVIAGPTYHTKKWRREDLLTPEQAAEYLGLSPKTLANWRVKGAKAGEPVLRYIRAGGRIRYRYGDLVDFIEASCRENTSQLGGDDEEIEIF